MKRLVIVIAIILVCVVSWYLSRTRISSETSENKNRHSATREKGHQARPDGLAKMLLSINESTELHAGGGAYAVAFEDATLSPELKSFILRDLQSTYGHLTSVKVSPPLKGKETVTIGDKEFKITGMANFQGVGAYFPRAFMGKFGMLATIDGATAMVIPNELVDLYRPMYQSISDDPEMFDRLGAFIDSLNNFKTTPPRKIAEIATGHDAETDQAIKQMPVDAFLKEIGDKHYSLGSILEITTDPKQPDVFIVRTFVDVPGGKNEGVPLIYRDFEWKILFVVGE